MAIVHMEIVKLSAGHTKDPYLESCARNVWYLAAQHDIEVLYVHVLAKGNQVADLFSRWSNSLACWKKLCQYVENPLSIPVTLEMLDINYVI